MNVVKQIVNFDYKKSTGLVNLAGGFFALFIKEIFDKYNRPILIVSSNMLEARKIYNLFCDDDVILFEDDDICFTNDNVVSPELKIERLNIINELIENNKRIVITDILGFLRKIPNANYFKNSNLYLKKGIEISQNDILNKLINCGYNKESLVNKTGDFAIRGFVLDVFPINEENPVRIEFFGDEIESIRYFDVDSQLSIKEIDEIEVLTLKDSFAYDYSTIKNYLKDAIIIFKDYEQINIAFENKLNDSVDLQYDYNSYYCALKDIKCDDVLYYFDFDSYVNNKEISNVVDFNAINAPLFGENFTEINKFVKKALALKKTIVISTTTLNFNSFLEKLDFSYVITDLSNVYSNKVNIIRDKYASGFEKDDFVFLTDLELFGKKTVTYKKTKFKNTSKIRDLSKINIGDYVVHNAHGIGVYNGIKVLKKGEMLIDYLEILYAKGDKIYIPASKIELISKYNGKDGYTPTINSLNSTLWQKTKQRIREKIRIEAERLIKIQAEREVKKGYSFSKDSPMQEMFESEFIYNLTPDQEKVVNEIKKDMEDSKPMDRILCGDVGYGKTEVAFRAMFKAVFDSKQVLYLCPTTILCRQQYNVAIDRFKNYPVNIGIINRFVSTSNIKKTLQKLKNGEIDILFATHRGLSDDVIFRDLGLLVIDEEQRFGVIQKEKIKEIKSNVDVLTLTATPIPRTLQMAVLGIKNLSLIETPPKNRKSVVTYVVPFDKKLIREVVYKEVSRGGQVFILYNRVEDIESKVAMFNSLLPDVSINYAHGKMDQSLFEKVMNDFVDNKFNVLVCTTIIETGIDIPNVNSLIIMDADRFGLSQLYQIRGRVGRSDTLAYAYLMYEKSKILTEKAIKRLKVIKEYTELGSGFSIATKDLTIRGAGDILGSEQAGFIDSVGIDMYLKMLNEEIQKIKGESVSEDESEDINLTICSHIKDEYVKDEDIKIEIHKLINTINSYESLVSVKKIIDDRFGKIDSELDIYMNEQLFDAYVKKLGVIKVFDNSIYREVTFNEKASSKFNYEDIFVKSLKINNNFKFSYKSNKLIISLPYKKTKINVVYDFNKLFKELI